MSRCALCNASVALCSLVAKEPQPGLREKQKWAKIRTFFVFKYDDERKRREWFASCKGKMYTSRKFSDFVAMEDGFTVKDKNGVTFAFKPYKQFFIVVRGKAWEEAKPLFEAMMKNIGTIYP